VASVDRGLLEWAVAHTAPDANVLEVRGLRDGGSPWLLRLRGRDGERDVVLREEPSGAGPVEIEALQLAAANGIPAPALIASRDEAMLLEYVGGSGTIIPAERPPQRLLALGALAAAIHAVPVPVHLPRRTRPIASVDFDELRRATPVPLLEEAAAAVAATTPGGTDGFVHGDLWQGNVLWNGAQIAAVIDWDCAGVGRHGVDLGSLRCDAAMCFGLAAAADISAGWESAAGRGADDVAYWDLVAALSTPPDIAWFASAISAQGRPDLTKELLRQRRDEFVVDALARLRE
jgi:aminoglycoside phosphotransferase (APT) family kinase protein